MLTDPPQVVNTSIFAGAKNVSLIDSQFIEINYYIMDPGPAAVPPLPPLKHSSIFFTGRDEYLQRLRDHFTSDIEGQGKSFLLHGLGGIGKTQICLKFIEENSGLFSDIFWINASSESSIELTLMQISDAYNTSPDGKPSARSALKWISQRPNYLMIYDGADDHYSVVEKFFPQGDGGNILMTSRNAGLKRLSKNSAEVLDLEEEEAVSLLLQSAMLGDTSDHINSLAKQLVSQLGGIPLALDQAGAYMHSCDCSINNYLELYVNHKNHLMANTGFKGASGYGTSTYGTWDIAMRNIENMSSGNIRQEVLRAQSAIKLLRIFSFLDHVNIPQELFKNAAENYIKRDMEKEEKSGLPLSVRLLNHETLFLGDHKEWDKIQFLGGIQVLLSLALIKTHNKLYSIHPLVHAWSKNRVPTAERTNFYYKARALLSCSVALDYDVDNYSFCKLLAPHIKANNSNVSELRLQATYFDDENERYALVYHHTGDWSENELQLLVALDQRNTKFGSDHPGTLHSMHNLASTYWNQGRWDEAERLQLNVVDVRKRKLGSDHLDTLRSMSNLASTYREMARWNEAEQLEMFVMNARKMKLGSDHPETLNSMTNLATTYWNLGKWNEAEKLQVAVMNTSKVKLGPEHPDTLRSMNNLASTYRSQGRWDEAEQLQVHMMNVIKTKLGSDHPDTLNSMDNLAVTYMNQGRWNEAEKVQVDVMNASKTKLGSKHPSTLTSMHNLACTYRNQGKWDEAERLQVNVMNDSKAKLGSEHPETLIIITELSSIYNSQGRWDEAEKLNVDVMNARKEKLGPDHPDTLTSVHNLASTYINQQRWGEAEKLQVDVMNARKLMLGLDHLDTLSSMQSVAVTYMNQGRWDEAENLQLVVMNTRKTKLGSGHPGTLRSMSNLASLYLSQGRLNEAEKLQVDVMNARKAMLGTAHPDTLASIADLGITHSAMQGRLEEGGYMVSLIVKAMEQSMGPQHPITLHYQEQLRILVLQHMGME